MNEVKRAKFGKATIFNLPGIFLPAGRGGLIGLSLGVLAKVSIYKLFPTCKLSKTYLLLLEGKDHLLILLAYLITLVIIPLLWMIIFEKSESALVSFKGGVLLNPYLAFLWMTYLMVHLPYLYAYFGFLFT